jgi:CRP-like cAMP-binding protein
MSNSTTVPLEIPTVLQPDDELGTCEEWGKCYEGSAQKVSRIINPYKSGCRKVQADCDLFTIGDQDDSIYILLNGWVALYEPLEDGRRQILHFGLPGAVLGVVPGQVKTYSAQALTPATVCVIPRRNLKMLFRDHPEIVMPILALVSSDRNVAYTHLTNLGRRSARERIAYLLLELFVRFRMKWPGHRIEEMLLPLTQEDIGDATGLTNVHVNRVLRGLRKERIVEFHYKQLRILNPDKLIEIARIDQNAALSWVAACSSNRAMASQQEGNLRSIGHPYGRHNPHPISRVPATSNNSCSRACAC